MSDWKTKLPKVLPDKGNAHFVFAVKTETGFRTELSGTVNAKKLFDLFNAAGAIAKHKDGEELLYP